MTEKTHREEDEYLGMSCPISRRDFLQGVALGVTVPWVARRRQDEAATGSSSLDSAGELRGQDVSSTHLGHHVRDGVYRSLPADVVDTGEDYDLVVVGSGLAGLGAAYVYQREKRGDPRILILENNAAFGGHAQRNTFEWEGQRYVATGGTYDLEDPFGSPPGAMEILTSVGIDFDRLEGFRDPQFRERFRLSPSVFFDPRVYSGIRPAWVNGFHEIPYEQFFAKAPLSETARRELVELYTTRKNYLPEAENTHAALASMSWEEFIREKMRLGDDAVRFANLYSTDLIGLGCDAVSALQGHEIGPGFFGMGGEGFYQRDGMLRYGYQPVHRFPDGNHTVARHLLKKILPDAVPGPDTMEGVFNSALDEDPFDQPQNRVRLRLRSVVVRLEHERGRENGKNVVVHYAKPDGRVYRVRARGAIMAGWGMAAKHVVPELPEGQLDALKEYGYTSAIYINVLLRHWRPIADTGAFEMYLPDGYCTWMHVSDPLRVGEYHPEYHPDQPTVLSMFKYLYKPGLPPSEQMTLGRYQLENKTFETFEREIRSELNHVLGPWGFEAARDILAITVNRWGHGYTIFWTHPDKTPPYVTGRTRLGRISFAGADAGGTPWSQAALEVAWRAAHEQLELD